MIYEAGRDGQDPFRRRGQTHDRSGNEKSHSRVGSWRTRAGVCCAGESGVEGGMGEYMRLSREGP